MDITALVDGWLDECRPKLPIQNPLWAYIHNNILMNLEDRPFGAVAGPHRLRFAVPAVPAVNGTFRLTVVVHEVGSDTAVTARGFDETRRAAQVAGRDGLAIALRRVEPDGGDAIGAAHFNPGRPSPRASSRS